MYRLNIIYTAYIVNYKNYIPKIDTVKVIFSFSEKILIKGILINGENRCLER
jgi:hypothetical protein